MPTPINGLILVADPGPDPDDAKGILLAAHYHMNKKLRLLGVICCGGGQAEKRARLCRCLLQQCYPKLKIPVAIGASGDDKPHKPAPHEYNLAGFETTSTTGMPTGVGLLKRLLHQSEPQGLIVEIQAAFTDVAQVLQTDQDLFKSKVRCICAMGGLRDPHAQVWEADAAYNNELDRDAANTVYRFCQNEGVQLIVIGREAVPLLPMTQMRSIAETTNHPVMRYLSEAQDGGLIALWGRVCRKELPERCTKEWYFTTFCGVLAEDYRKLEEQGVIKDDMDIQQHLHGTVKPYDPMTVMSTLDRDENKRYFDWEKGALPGKGCTHYIFQTPDVVFGTKITRDIVSGLRFAADEGHASGCTLMCT